jgi:hypothetical protein
MSWLIKMNSINFFLNSSGTVRQMVSSMYLCFWGEILEAGILWWARTALIKAGLTSLDSQPLMFSRIPTKSLPLSCYSKGAQYQMTTMACP